MKTIDIPLERLGPERFEPFGQILMPQGKPQYTRQDLENWRVPFSSEDVPRVQIMRYSKQDMRLSMFERHLSVTEARHPIGVAAAVLVVASANAKTTKPDAATVRAFLLNGVHGIIFHRGIWHGLDCFPVCTPFVDYLFLSDAATEDEIEGQSTPTSALHTHVHDFAAHGIEFRVTDPEGILS